MAGAIKAGKSIESTRDLRLMLIQTIEQVRSGKLEAKQARTIATLSAAILQSAKLDLDFLRFHAATSDGTKKINEKPLNLVG